MTSPHTTVVRGLHQNRINREYRVMCDCRDGHDFEGALLAEARMNDELDRLGHEHATTT